jgi:diketogulonate reductase-like aldo/keto reductase
VERRYFGPARVQVPVLGIGTWQMETDPRPACVAAIRRAIDLGMGHVDTAEMYGAGRVEEMVAEAIEGRRDQVFLVSKVLPGNASYEGTIAACERSLARLKTDRLDCYLLHWPGEHPLEDTIRGFEKLVKQGKIKSWGLSNFDDAELAHAQKIAGEKKIACDQVLYHLDDRSIEHAVLPWCKKHGGALVAYSPFGNGRFPGPSTPRGKVLQEIADHHRATSHQVGLAFLIRDPSVFAIPKSIDPAHVEENALGASLHLTDQDVRKIEAAFPRPKRRSGLPMM